MSSYLSITIQVACGLPGKLLVTCSSHTVFHNSVHCWHVATQSHTVFHEQLFHHWCQNCCLVAISSTLEFRESSMFNHLQSLPVKVVFFPGNYWLVATKWVICMYRLAPVGSAVFHLLQYWSVTSYRHLSYSACVTVQVDSILVNMWYFWSQSTVLLN
jgi:hypothetical protein